MSLRPVFLVSAAAVLAAPVAAPLWTASSAPSSRSPVAQSNPQPGAVRRPSFTRGVVTNPWFPLKPGTRMVYTGTKDGESSRDVVVVLHRTRTIQGVVCRAVSDRLYLDGVLEERTTDWYAEDRRTGDVWYFGESTAELDENGGVVSREGSWLAGRDG